MALPRGTDIEYAGESASGGFVVGQTASELVGFYGVATPVAQRAFSSAVHGTAAAASSAAFGATQSAVLQEIQLTLIGLGIWATA